MTPCPRLGVAPFPLSVSLISVFLMSLTARPAYAASAAYELDPVHTRVMIAVEHAGFSKAIGTVSGSSGTLQFDPEDWTTAALEVSVPMERLDLGDEKWNRAVLARNLLDVEEFPTATFVSTRIEPIDRQHASVYGTLTLHGVAKEVKLEVTLNAFKRHPLPPFRRTAGFSATATLSRADFGVDAWKSVIGDSVELRMEVEATRARKDDGTTDVDQEEPASAPIPPTEPPTP